MRGAGTKPEQFGLLPYPQATVCKENFPQLLDLACLPSFHRPQGIVVCCCAHLHPSSNYVHGEKAQTATLVPVANYHM